MNLRDNLHRLALVALLLPLALYGFISVYSRLLADDYCYGSTLIEYGFLGGITHYYQEWFGRLTQTVGAGVGVMLGVPFAQVFPILLLIAWLLALRWLVVEINRATGRAPDVPPLLVAAIFLYATLAGTPQILHSLYWISAVFPFLFPLVLLTAFFALTARYRQPAPLPLIGGALLALIAGLASEQYAVVQISLFAALLVALWRSPRRVMVGIGLIAGVIALIIMVAAPGNTYRQGLFTPTRDPLTLITQSVQYATAFIAASFVYFSPGAVIAAVGLLPLLRDQATDFKISRWWFPVIGFGLLVAFCLPAIYATSQPPPARTYSIAQFVLVGALLLFSLTIRVRVRPRIRAALVIALLIAAPILTMIQVARLVPILSAYAASWDAQAAVIRAAAPASNVIAPPVEPDIAARTGLESLIGQTDYWINECAAIYYGVNTISVQPHP